MQQKFVPSMQLLIRLQKAVIARFIGFPRKATHARQRGLALAVPVIALGSYLPASGQTMFNFQSDRSGTTQDPIFGLASTDDNYMLSGSSFTRDLPLNFTENNQDDYAFDNPFTPVVDAASFNNNYIIQLDSSGNIRKVNTADGTTDSSFGVVSTGTSNTFGIGYDSNTNRIGIGQMNGSDMRFGTYDIATDTLSFNDEFTFDTSQYGTPTGLDIARVGNSDRMFVGTRDGPSINPSNPSAPERNFILDMGLTGFDTPWQYGTTSGNFGQLQDVHFLDGKLALAYQTGIGNGRIQVMDNFTAIPEPSYYTTVLSIFITVVLIVKLRSKNIKLRN